MLKNVEKVHSRCICVGVFNMEQTVYQEIAESLEIAANYLHAAADDLFTALDLVQRATETTVKEGENHAE